MDWRLHNGEALAWLRGLPENSVDAVVTDPPYSSGGAFRGDRAASTTTKYTQDSDSGAKFKPGFDGDNRDQRSYLLWSQIWLTECLRIAKPGAVVAVFTDWRQLPVTTDAVQVAGWVWRGIVVWDKTEAARPQPGRPRNQAEYVVWGSRGELSSDRDAPVLPGVLRHYQQASDRHHQTGKPLAVMRPLVRLCERGGCILDPFAGSGSTGVAALLEEYSFLGCEQSAVYHDLALRRLAAAARGYILQAGEAHPPEGQAVLPWGGA